MAYGQLCKASREVAIRDDVTILQQKIENYADTRFT